MTSPLSADPPSSRSPSVASHQVRPPDLCLWASIAGIVGCVKSEPCSGMCTVENLARGEPRAHVPTPAPNRFARTSGRGPGRSGAELKAVVESVVDPTEVPDAHQTVHMVFVDSGWIRAPEDMSETLDGDSVLQQFEPFFRVPHPPKRRESPPAEDRAARPKAALEDAAGPMERDRTTTSMAVSARPAAPGTTGFEDAQAPMLPSHLMRPR